MRVAVLIPCYNEEATIERVVLDFHDALPGAIVYVYDNNSTDRSGELASRAGAQVVREPRQGKGFVVRSMFRNVDADVYVMVDGDGTYDARSVAALAGPVMEGRADMVVGDRLASGYFEENSRPLHGAGNRLVRWLVNSIFDANVADIMTGARAFSRYFVQTYPVLSEGFEIETEMTIHALDKDFRVESMPVDYRERVHGSVSKLHTFRDGFGVLKTIVALFKDFRPLSFAAIAATVLGCAALILFAAPLDEYLTTGMVAKFPSLIVAVALGTSSLLTLFAGAILDSLRKQSRMLYELELNRWVRSQAHAEIPAEH